MELMQRGWSPPFSEFAALLLESSQKHPKIAPLLSEFGQIVQISVPEQVHPPAINTRMALVPFATPSTPDNWGIKTKASIEAHASKIDDASTEAPPSNSFDANCRKNLCFGVYRSRHESVRDAAEAGHPIGRDAMLPPALSDAISFVSSKSQHEVAMDRHGTLTHWLGRAKALVEEGWAFHNSLPCGVQSILAPKRLLLWREMLMHYGYPDLLVFDEVVNGTDLVGAVPAMPYFDASFKPA